MAPPAVSATAGVKLEEGDGGMCERRSLNVEMHDGDGGGNA